MVEGWQAVLGLDQERSRHGARAPAACYAGTMSTDDILTQALQLPRRDRARVAQELLSSLEEPDEAVAAAWAEELERRVRSIADGTAKLLPWEQVRDEIRAELKRNRESRGPSGSSR
jgi:putative addiction module component (TIGR02574 family)